MTKKISHNVHWFCNENEGKYSCIKANSWFYSVCLYMSKKA